MKQRKTKITAGALVLVMLLTSVFTLGAFASEEIPTSTYYEIDAAAHTVKGLLHNTFVGDFMARINSGSSVKKLVDADGHEVFNGFVDDTMKLCIGNTQYSLEYFMLYDLGAKMKDYLKDKSSDYSEVMLEFTGGTRNEYASAVKASDLVKNGLFSLGVHGGGSDADYAASAIKATVKKSSDEQFLEITSNSTKQLHLVTEDFSSKYRNIDKYSNAFIVTDVNVKSINYGSVETEPTNGTRSGIVSINHYYKNANTSKPNPAARPTSDIFSGDADSFIFNERAYLSLGGNGTTVVRPSSAPFRKANGYTENTAYNVKIYNNNLAYSEGSTALQNPVAALFINDAQETVSSYNMTPTTSVTSVDGISNATIGIASNRVSSTVYAETTAQISDFKVYLAENIENKSAGECKIIASNGTGEGTDNNGYELSYDGNTLNNVIPQTTVAELISKLKLSDNAYAVVYSSRFSDQRRLADSDIITTGNQIKVYKGVGTSADAKGYTITLSTYGAALSDNTVTVTGNAKGVRFIAAAYNEEGKLTEVKIIPSGESSASFATAPLGAKVFALKDLVTLTPVTEVLPASSSAE